MLVPGAQHSDLIFLYVYKMMTAISLVTICHRTKIPHFYWLFSPLCFIPMTHLFCNWNFVFPFFFFEKYSWCIIISKFQVYNRMSHSFAGLYSIYNYYKILTLFPVLYIVALKLIYFICSLYLLVSHLFLSPIPAVACLFSVPVTLCFLRFVYLFCILDFTCK